jgi:hypothetical protein
LAFFSFQRRLDELSESEGTFDTALEKGAVEQKGRVENQDDKGRSSSFGLAQTLRVLWNENRYSHAGYS